MSFRLEKLWERSGDSDKTSAKEALEQKLSAAAARFDPIGIQEALIEHLLDEKHAPKPQKFAKEAAETIHVMTGREFNPAATSATHPGIPGINRVWGILDRFHKAPAKEATRAKLLAELRAIDFNNL